MTYIDLTDKIVYAFAVIGIAGILVIAGIWVTSIHREPFTRLLGACVLWQGLPVTVWLISYWSSYTPSGPSVFFRVVEAITILVVPVVSGLVHRSWKLFLLNLAAPFIAFGLMMAVFIVLMGDGR